MRRFLFLFLSIGFIPHCVEFYDVVIYGGTSAGVVAAVQLSRLGKSALLIEPTGHLGGMTSNGIGWVDVGNPHLYGGLCAQFFHEVWLHYEEAAAWKWEPKHKIKGQLIQEPPKETLWVLEPHVSEMIFESWVKQHAVCVARNERLDRRAGVLKKGGRIYEIKMDSGRAFSGLVFIDASYEGDLFAGAQVSHTIGRESNDLYGETLNGIHPNYSRSELPARPIDPYRVVGHPSSGLLPRIHPTLGGKEGEGDRSVQAFNFRMCLTDVPENRVPIEKPKDYNELDYEIVFRAIRCGMPLNRFFKLSMLPNRKTDSNNFSNVSTDYIGMSSKYIESDFAMREQTALAHKNWQLGLIWTLQNHPKVPKKVRAFYAPWGLPKDEFIDNGNWPYSLYIREGRRMVSDFVVTEKTLLGQESILDPIGYSSYPMDSHCTKYFVGEDGFLTVDGAFFRPLPQPAPIPYRAIIPKKSECTNLFVPVCLSASHVAYGSLRMEPIFMCLGQAAAIGASLSIDHLSPVQEVPYSALKELLRKSGQIFKQ